MMWEYQIVVMPSKIHNQEKVLNEFGAAGWELIHFETKPHGTMVAYFRRPK